MDIAPGKSLRVFSPTEARALAEQWLLAFGGSGAPNTKSYMWHTLCAQAYPSLSLREAEAAYLQHTAPTFIVLSNDRDQAIETDQRPTSCSESDYYVFPPNLAWTLAITHEDGWLGPYFAKHKDFCSLNAANLEKIKKAHAAELAKKMGWR
jgi:hypothetical protein